VGSEARKLPDNDQDTVEVPANDFSRLVRALERLVTVEERKLAARGSAERRALKQAGPTTDEAIARAEKRLRKMRGTP
jgi:hypothetical protein